ncbi:MAG: hypothetical protein K1X38_05045 [Microthrixaceae bacterium]|nr:hypothetical protein [Microthrixaceae bacterium]
MAFKGEVLSIGALLERSLTASDFNPSARMGVLHTAADNAARCARRLIAGESPEQSWRFGILQTLDDYSSTYRRGGSDLAAQVFAAEPAPTGSAQLDAAFAALAEHLAERDGWATPAWALNPERRTTEWYPAVPAIFRAEAKQEAPLAFRKRGIYITQRSLSRA